MSSGHCLLRDFSEANHDVIAAHLANSWKTLQNVRKAAVYDVVYQPAPTLLLTLARMRGLRCLGGEMMNLDQAVVAFKAVGPICGDQLAVSSIQEFMLLPKPCQEPP